MKIAVYPHDLAMGGSQLNAIEIAAAVQRLGHPTVIVGRPGVLVERIADLGLDFLELPAPSKRPSRRVARHLRQLVKDRQLDIVHGYEWPPTLEAAWAVGGQSARVVSTVMSMAVAPFIPRTVPLLVGTEQIAATEIGFGRTDVGLLEPPVDLRSNDHRVDYGAARFRADHGVSSDELLVVVVSRLAHQLKLEGILAAMDAVGRLRSNHPIRLCIVGDGPAGADVRDAVTMANDRYGDGTVIAVGEVSDPRAAYQAADVTLGMGGSALRAIAFERPLIVQGELGFWRRLDQSSVQDFLWTGWYGIGDGADRGVENLIAELEPLTADSALRHDLGRFGRTLVEDRFSIEVAAERQIEFYAHALAARVPPAKALVETATGLLRYSSYYAAKRIRRARGLEQVDDFNARALMPRRVPDHAESSGV